MNISRNFLVVGSVYLLLRNQFGTYKGGAGNHKTASVRAHVSLPDFTPMAVFTCMYKSLPSMVDGMLATFHFRLHQVGTLVLVIMLLLLVSGNISAAGMAPMAPLAEALVRIGIAGFM